MKKSRHAALHKLLGLLFIGKLMVGHLAEAQTQQPVPELSTFNQQRQRLNHSGMLVLGAWGAGNLITNALLLNKAQGSDKAFYQMNLAWGAVDLVLAGAGLLGSRRAKTDLSVYVTLEEQQKIEKLFLVNVGLDVAYLTGGLYLKERDTPKNAERNEGYGNALLVQGGFLLLFDGAMYAVHRAHFKRNKRFWQRLEVVESGVGVKVNF